MLVGDDGGPAAAEAGALARRLAAGAGLETLAVHVESAPVPFGVPPPTPAGALGLRPGPTARRLTEAADAHDACLIAIGARRAGLLGRLVPGSVLASLIEHPPCATLVVPATASPVERVRVAITNGVVARAALPLGAAVARRMTARLSVVSLVEDTRAPSVESRRSRPSAEERTRSALRRSVGRDAELEMRYGDPRTQLLALGGEPGGLLLLAGSGPQFARLVLDIAGYARSPVIVADRAAACRLTAALEGFAPVRSRSR